MDRIYKTQIITGEEIISTRKFLKVGMQHGFITIWYIYNEEENIDYNIQIVGTGWERDLHDLMYLGTVEDGSYIWHLFADQIRYPN